MKKPVALIMEDDPVEQESLKLALESAGFEVVQVYDYNNARKLIEQIIDGHFNLMFCDGVIIEDLAKPKNFVKTTHLVRQARKASPNMLMIAMSNDKYLRDEHFAFGEMISPGHNLTASKKDLTGCFSSLKRSS